MALLLVSCSVAFLARRRPPPASFATSAARLEAAAPWPRCAAAGWWGGRVSAVARAAGEAVPRESFDDDEEDYLHRIQVSELKIGQELDGVVNSVRDFGAFVDVGADRDGLVHISRISEGFVDDIAMFVAAGQQVKVWVTGVTEEGKLSLSMIEGRGKDDTRDLSEEIAGFGSMAPDEWITGTVRQITDFCVYVSVSPPGGGPMAQGMVHISQMKEGFVEHPAEEVKIGQEVRVRVLSVDPLFGRLRLSMTAQREGIGASGRPSEELVARFESVDPGVWLEGPVHHTTPFGVFVELRAPLAEGEVEAPLVQGLVHVTEMREGFVDDPQKEVEIGQIVRVRVVRVDPAAGRLSLSMNPLPSPTVAL